MALQGKFLRLCSVYSNFRNAIPTNTYNWYNNPCIQQIAGLKQTIEEKLNIPPKPKRPLTPYFKFMAQIRPEIKKENPNAKAPDIVREISHRWEKLDAKTKHQFESDYKKEQSVYAKIRLDYDTTITPAQKELIKEEKVKQNEIKEKRKLKLKCKEYNKPKKPCSGFVLFMKGELPKRGDKNFKDFQKSVAESWAKLTDAEKKPFQDEMHNQMKEYQKEMVEWERKMIKLGNTDIVRQDALIDPRPKTRATRRKVE